MAKTKKTNKQAQAKKTAKPGRKSNTATVKAVTAVDTFGTRVGTLAHKVNVYIAKHSGVTMKQIRVDGLGGHTENFYNHCNALIHKGLITKGPKGYTVAKGQKLSPMTV